MYASAATYEAYCASPRSGTDPSTGSAFPDRPGSAVWENFWLRSWTNAYYLWYNEVVDVNPAGYSTPDYFRLMKTNQTTASGRPKDRFHFSIPTDQWYALAESGEPVGYGIGWSLISSAPPRKVLVAYVETNATQSVINAAIPRGAEVLSVDGVDMVTGTNAAALNAGLYPSKANESHTFVIRDTPSSSPRSVTLTSGVVTSAPVQNVSAISQPGGKVGYVLFNAQEANAESNMVEAINALKTAGVTDVILDLRYNGGGFLIVASEVAYMLAGPTATAGKVFEEEQFNGKFTVSGSVVPFQDTTVGFSGGLPAGQALPFLGLSRVFVITTADTCSASESIINGLRGIDIPVFQIGSTTCGKPYGFFPDDNCGTTYFSIQLRGVNNKGFGEFPDGFGPANATGVKSVSVPGCAVADDYTHAIGDTSEGMLAAALQYRLNSTCPSVTKVSQKRSLLYRNDPNLELRKPETMTNKFMHRQ